jgi:hypothetical protein
VLAAVGGRMLVAGREPGCIPLDLVERVIGRRARD